MAGETEELQILIKTLADTYGLKEVNNALSNMQHNVQESGHEIEKHNEHHREMHVLFRQLNRLLPESGHLLHGIFGGPQILLIMATVAAISKLVEVQKEHNEKLKEATELAAKANMTVWTKAQEEARAARQEIEKFNHEMVATARNYDLLKQKQEEYTAVIKVYADALAKEAEGDKVRTEELKKRSEVMKLDAEQHNIKELQAQLGEDQGRLAKAQQARAAGAQGGAAAATAEVENEFNKKKMEEAFANFKKLEDMQKRGAELMTAPERISNGVPLDFEKQLAKATEELEKTKNNYVASTAAIDAHTRQVERLTAEEKEAEDAVRHRTEQIRSAQGEHRRNEAAFGAGTEAQREQLLRNAGVPEGAMRAPIGRTIISGIEAIEQRGYGEKIDPGSLAIIDGLVGTLQRQGATQDQINGLIKEMLDMHTDQAKKVQDLWNALHVTRQQIKTTVNP